MTREEATNKVRKTVKEFMDAHDLGSVCVSYIGGIFAVVSIANGEHVFPAVEEEKKIRAVMEEHKIKAVIGVGDNIHVSNPGLNNKERSVS